MKKSVSYIIYAISFLLVAVGTFTYMAPHLGWSVDAVITGSMEPSLKVGSVVVIHPVTPESINTGDIISYRLNDKDNITITHRVIEVRQRSPLYLVAKGDANNQPDPFIVQQKNVLGRVCLAIPFCGYFTQFLKTNFGYLVVIVIPLVSVITLYIISVIREITGNKGRNALAREQADGV